MKLQLFSLLLLLALANAQDPFNLDDLIKDIFNTNETVPTQPTVLQPTPGGGGGGTFPPTKPTVLNPTPSIGPNSGTGGGPGPIAQPDKYKSCGLQKECVPRFLCSEGQINEDGLGIIDIRIDSDADCAYLELCCNIADKTSEPIKPPPPKEVHLGCGYSNPNGIGYRITGNNDNEAEFGEFPWMVAVLREEEAAGEILSLYECGGALIAPNAVVTAAHCVDKHNARNLVVRAGEWDTQTSLEVFSHVDRQVKESVIHEGYNKGTLFNDIAVLILEQPFEFQENIQPICLPPPNTQFDHSRCYATGWGKNKFGREGIYQVILKKIDLPVVPRSTCQENLRTTRLGKYYKLHDSFICAGGEKDKDTCKGDGGSPLVCPIAGSKDRYYQAGIVAWGIGCGEENIPGVYASVSYLRNWLNGVLNNKGVDFSYFTA